MTTGDKATAQDRSEKPGPSGRHGQALSPMRRDGITWVTANDLIDLGVRKAAGVGMRRAIDTHDRIRRLAPLSSFGPPRKNAVGHRLSR
jgi:hypothetical protein